MTFGKKEKEKKNDGNEGFATPAPYRRNRSLSSGALIASVRWNCVPMKT